MGLKILLDKFKSFIENVFRLRGESGFSFDAIVKRVLPIEKLRKYKKIFNYLNQLKIKIKCYWGNILKLKSHLDRLFWILLVLSALFFYLSVFWARKNNPFWSDYSMSLSVGCLTFIVAIFLIDFLIRQKEKQKWDDTKKLIDHKIRHLHFHLLYLMLDYLGFSHTEYMKMLFEEFLRTRKRVYFLLFIRKQYYESFGSPITKETYKCLLKNCTQCISIIKDIMLYFDLLPLQEPQLLNLLIKIEEELNFCIGSDPDEKLETIGQRCYYSPSLDIFFDLFEELSITLGKTKYINFDRNSAD